MAKFKNKKTIVNIHFGVISIKLENGDEFSITPYENKLYVQNTNSNKELSLLELDSSSLIIRNKN